MHLSQFILEFIYFIFEFLRVLYDLLVLPAHTFFFLFAGTYISPCSLRFLNIHFTACSWIAFTPSQRCNLRELDLFFSIYNDTRFGVTHLLFIFFAPVGGDHMQFSQFTYASLYRHLDIRPANHITNNINTNSFGFGYCRFQFIFQNYGRQKDCTCTIDREDTLFTSDAP